MFASTRVRAIIAVAVTVGAATITLSTGNHSAPAAFAQSAGTAEAMTSVEVVQTVNPAVVTVINRQVLAGTSTDQSVPQGAGTGFFIDDAGTVVTNQHVVDDGDDFSVFLSTGEEREAELIGADETSDLAVLRVAGDVPAVVAFGDSDALLPGETVLAIGSPLGTFTNTVTEGIISAIGRTPQEFQSANAVYTNLIQHDAAINPGNSGGPLFNLAGEVVGVNTLGIPQTGSGQIAQGLFFAIPSSTVQDVVRQLVEDGEVAYPFFGVESLPVTDVIVAQADLSVDYGQVVITVSDDSPAAAADIEPGDVIIEIDGEAIDSDTPFIEILFDHEPGDTVSVTVQRGDETIETQVTLAERPA